MRITVVSDIHGSLMPLEAVIEELEREHSEVVLQGGNVVLGGRELGALTVANSGSVGEPFDGDCRASYLLIEDGSASVRRVEYDLKREVADLESSGYPDASPTRRDAKGGPLRPSRRAYSPITLMTSRFDRRPSNSV